MKEETITSRAFNQDLAAAKRAAKITPVIITDRGRPAHVLLSFDAYKKLTTPERSLGEALACPEAADIDLPLELEKTRKSWENWPIPNLAE